MFRLNAIKINHAWLLLILFAAVANFGLINKSNPLRENKFISGVRDAECDVEDDKILNTTNVDSSVYLTNIQHTGVYHKTGRTMCIVISESDSNHVLAGGEYGGLWVSDNRCNSWQPVNDFALTLKVTSIAQNHFQNNEYYYSTGVYKKDNAGAFTTDLYRSIDGGYHFTPIVPTTPMPIKKVTKIICSPIDSNTIYVLGEEGTAITTSSLFKTTNKFKTYTKVFSLGINSMITDFEVSSTGAVTLSMVNNGAVWTSSTGNAGTFQAAVTTIPSTLVYPSIAFCKNQPQIGYLAGTSNGTRLLYKTVNGGVNWNFVDTIPGSGAWPALAVKPDNPDILFIGNASLYGSINGGLTWVQNYYSGWDIQMIHFDPTNSNLVFFSSDTGIRSLNLGQMTGATYGPSKLYDNSLINQDIMHGDFGIRGNTNIVGLLDIGSYLNKANGSSSFLTGGDGCFSFCSKQDSNIAYTSTQNGNIMRLDHVTTSSSVVPIRNQLDADHNGTIDEGVIFIHPFVMNDADDRQLYFPTKKRLWRSTDRGNNWTPISNYYATTSSFMSVTATVNSNPNVYWTNDDSVFVMKHAATAIASDGFGMPAPASPLKVVADINNDSVALLIGRNLPAKIFRSSNLFLGNIQWTDLSVNFPESVTPNCIAAYPGNSRVLLVGALEGGIYITVNGGLTWTKEKNFPNAKITEIKVRPSDKRIFIFTHGRGAWTAEYQMNVVLMNLLSFKAVANESGKTALLSWKTSEEIHTGSFDVERSFDGHHFIHLTNISAVGFGNNFYSRNISMIAQTEYYRLRINDRDGKFTYSTVVKVMLPAAEMGFNVIKSQMENIFLLEVKDKRLINSYAMIVDNSGRVLQQIVLKQGLQEINLQNMASGTYYIRTFNGAVKIVNSR